MWHKQRFIDTMTYLLDQLQSFDVTPLESLLLINIHHMNNHKDAISLEILAKHVHASIKEVDDAIDSLQKKGWLVIEHCQGFVLFNIDTCFLKTSFEPTQVATSLHDSFEQSFKRLLSEKEYNQLSLWSKMYSETMIIHALRQALIQEKLSMGYIGKILENWKKSNIQEEDLFHE